MPTFYDRVADSTTTTGTGTITLSGTAPTSFQNFSCVGDGNTVYYCIVDSAGNWEVGLGTYSASGPTLARNTVYASSNSGSAINIAAGTTQVFAPDPANWLNNPTVASLTDTGALTQSGGAVSLTANAPSTFTTTSGSLTIDSGSGINLGSTTASTINIGNASSTTTFQGTITGLPSSGGTNQTLSLSDFQSLAISCLDEMGVPFAAETIYGGLPVLINLVGLLAGTSSASTSTNPSGTVIAYAGSTVPTGYLYCDGSAVGRNQYPSLFTAIGTTWGTGDGHSTFTLPDLRDRVLISTSPGSLSGNRPTAQTLGSTGGEETHTLVTNEMPSHAHSYSTFQESSAGSGTFAFSSTGGYEGSNPNTGNTGGGAAHNNLQPYAVIQWIIKT